MNNQLSNHEDPWALIRQQVELIQQNSDQGFYGEIDRKGWEGITFLLGDEHYLIALEDIVEIIPLPKLTPIPNVSRWLKGITNFRGDILIVSDLKDFIEKKESEITQKTRVFIISMHNELVGIMVDQVINLLKVPIDIKSTEAIEKDPSSYLKGIYKLNNQIYKLISIDKLIQCELFSVVN